MNYRALQIFHSFKLLCSAVAPIDSHELRRPPPLLFFQRLDGHGHIGGTSAVNGGEAPIFAYSGVTGLGVQGWVGVVRSDWSSDCH